MIPVHSTTCNSARGVGLGRTLVKLLAGLLAVLRVGAASSAWAALLLVAWVPLLPLTLSGTRVRIASSRLGGTFPVPGREHDLQLDQFVPLRIGALPFGNR